MFIIVISNLLVLFIRYLWVEPGTLVYCYMLLDYQCVLVVSDSDVVRCCACSANLKKEYHNQAIKIVMMICVCVRLL